MGARKDAIMRVWALIWQATVGYVAVTVMGIVGIVWMILDVAWQLITGRDGLGSSSQVAGHIGDAFQWTASQTVFAVTGGGDGRFRWFWTT
jgi:hypothetical protein